MNIYIIFLVYYINSILSYVILYLVILYYVLVESYISVNVRKKKNIYIHSICIFFYK